MSVRCRLCVAGSLAGVSGDVPWLVMMWRSSSDLLSCEDKLDLLTGLIWLIRSLGHSGETRRKREKRKGGEEREKNDCVGGEREEGGRDVRRRGNKVTQRERRQGRERGQTQTTQYNNKSKKDKENNKKRMWKRATDDQGNREGKNTKRRGRENSGGEKEAPRKEGTRIGLVVVAAGLRRCRKTQQVPH